MFKACVIDDESLARSRVIELCGAYPEKIQIIGEASGGKQAIKIVEKLQPDLLFLDIQMPDINGFEVLSMLSYHPFVIFTTAYEKYAIRAFETYSVDYLVKPIELPRFEKAILKMEKFGRPSSIPDLKTLFDKIIPPKQSYSFPIKTGDRILLIDYEDISYFQAENKYVQIFTLDGKKYLSESSLHKLEKTLPETFIRIHRSYIVNRTHIQEIHKFFKGKIILKLKDKERSSLMTGGTYSAEVKRKLGI